MTLIIVMPFTFQISSLVLAVNDDDIETGTGEEETFFSKVKGVSFQTAGLPHTYIP